MGRLGGMGARGNGELRGLLFTLLPVDALLGEAAHSDALWIRGMSDLVSFCTSCRNLKSQTTKTISDIAINSLIKKQRHQSYLRLQWKGFSVPVCTV